MVTRLKDLIANKSPKTQFDGKTEATSSFHRRYEFIDIIRATAVILMIFFHLFYDLAIFGFVRIDFQKDFFWWFLPRVIVTLFLIAMGLSLELGPKKINTKKLTIRIIKIGGCALIISLTTFLLFPDNWIYFGTLHCIASCTLLALPFRGRPKITAFLAGAILIPLLFDFEWPFFKLNFSSMDYIPTLPWIALVFIGMALHHIGFHKLGIPPFKGKKILLTLSQYSLFIYVIHQPILFGLTFLVHKVFR